MPRSGKAAKKSVQQSVKYSSQRLVQEKHDGKLRVYIIKQVLHIRAKWNNFKERSLYLFSTRSFRKYAIAIIGFSQFSSEVFSFLKIVSEIGIK